MKSVLEGIENCGLHTRTCYGDEGVSRTIFSVARYYGGCKIQGESYTYIPTTDELIRDDVLKWKQKQAKKAKSPAVTKQPISEPVPPVGDKALR